MDHFTSRRGQRNIKISPIPNVIERRAQLSPASQNSSAYWVERHKSCRGVFELGTTWQTGIPNGELVDRSLLLQQQQGFVGLFDGRAMVTAVVELLGFVEQRGNFRRFGFRIVSLG